MKSALAGLAAVLVLLVGCDDETQFVPGPGPSKVDVDTPELRELKAEIGLEPCRPGPGGGALPAVTLPCLGGGKSVDLSSLRGPLVLSLWQAGCEPCKEEMPALQAFHEQYGDAVPVLGVDFADTYPGSALEEAGERGVTYPSLADPGGDLHGHRRVREDPGHADALLRRRRRTASRMCSREGSTRSTTWPTWSASTSG